MAKLLTAVADESSVTYISWEEQGQYIGMQGMVHTSCKWFHCVFWMLLKLVLLPYSLMLTTVSSRITQSIDNDWPLWTPNHNGEHVVLSMSLETECFFHSDNRAWTWEKMKETLGKQPVFEVLISFPWWQTQQLDSHKPRQPRHWPSVDG